VQVCAVQRQNVYVRRTIVGSRSRLRAVFAGHAGKARGEDGRGRPRAVVSALRRGGHTIRRSVGEADHGGTKVAGRTGRAGFPRDCASHVGGPLAGRRTKNFIIPQLLAKLPLRPMRRGAHFASPYALRSAQRGPRHLLTYRACPGTCFVRHDLAIGRCLVRVVHVRALIARRPHP
jgi:hypothetical protein